MSNVVLAQALEIRADNTVLLDLPDEVAAAFDALAEARAAKKEAEAREDAAKALILAALPNRIKGVTFIARVGGALRGKITRQSRVNVNAKDLLAAFPEAYEATAKTSEYDVIR